MGTDRQRTGDATKWLAFPICPNQLLCNVLTGIPRAFKIFILHIGQVRWSSSQGSTQDLWKRCLQWETRHFNSNPPQHNLSLSTRHFFCIQWSASTSNGAVCDLCKDCKSISYADKALKWFLQHVKRICTVLLSWVWKRRCTQTEN